MSESFTEVYPKEKTAFYRLLNAQLKALIEEETCWLTALSNASALLYGALENINWAGFYLVSGGVLLLGPFQGRPACTRIPKGRGVCGACWQENAPQLIANVHEFAGHIACDSTSNSEIVLPLRQNGAVVGLLDIDSPLLSRFDEEDLRGLAQFASMVEAAAADAAAAL